MTPATGTRDAPATTNAAESNGDEEPEERVLLCKNFKLRIEMEEKMMHEAPFCLLFTVAFSLMVISQFSAFDGAVMSSVTRNLQETYRVQDIEYLNDAAHVVETLEGRVH